MNSFIFNSEALAKRYCLVGLFFSVFFCAALLCASLMFLRSDTYLKFSKYGLEAITDVKFNFSGIDADVVIVGDSSALNNVDPLVLQKQTGMSAINLGLTAYSGELGFKMITERYLRQNRPPQLIIFYLSGRGAAQVPSYGHYEQAMIVLRYAPVLEAAKFLIQHPVALTALLGNLWDRVLRLEFDFRGLVMQDRILATKERRGFLSQPGPTLSDDCMLGSFIELPSLDFISGFTRRFTRQGTKAIAYLSPFAECDNSADYYYRQLASSVDNGLVRLPGRYFRDDIHMSPEGAYANSVLLANFIERIGLGGGKN